MMTRGGEGGKKCRKIDDVICERPLIINSNVLKCYSYYGYKYTSVIGHHHAILNNWVYDPPFLVLLQI